MEGKAILKELLSKRLRIRIRDGRVIDGLFMCTDNACNVVLSNCEEFLSQADVDEVENNGSNKTSNIRTLGLAIVPGQEITSISVQESFLSPELIQVINN